jgi:hypothetical protein
MSVRESRLCDSPHGFGPNDDLCPLPAIDTCPVCKQDRCEAHRGQFEVKISMESSQRNGSAVVIGYIRIKVCETCMKQVTSLDAAPLVEPVCVLLAAAVTAKTLAPPEPK